MKELRAKRHRMHLFSVVRNPWAWHVSWYHALRQHDDMGMPQLARVARQLPFDKYLRWLDGPSRSTDIVCYPRWQMRDWLLDIDGVVGVDTVLRTENLLAGMTQVLREHGVRRGDLQPVYVSATKHGPYWKYYNSRTRDIVARRHRDDIALFGFCYEGGNGV